jgi:Uma2 family endonuclease
MIALRDYLPKCTPAEYLAWESKQEFRHEYIDGEILAMTGGTIDHSKIAVNFSTMLRNHLRGTGCTVLNSDAKVQIVESNAYCYPDISVTCNEQDRNSSQFISHPCLIAEVLSPSTEAYDRGKKLRLYRRSMSLQEYVLVSTNEVCLDIYQRNDQNQWVLNSYGEGDMVVLSSVNFSFSIEQVYEDVIFTRDE